MAVAKREKILAIVVLGVLVLLAGDRYVLTPLLEQEGVLQTQRKTIRNDIDRGQKLLDEREQLLPKWNRMVSSGLKNDPAEAEGQLLHAIRDWAKEYNFTLTSIKPERPESKDTLREIHVQATGTGGMESISKFLWKAQSATFPLKITELQLGSRTDGTNDLSLQVKISTLYLAPAKAPAVAAKPGNGGAQ